MFASRKTRVLTITQAPFSRFASIGVWYIGQELINVQQIFVYKYLSTEKSEGGFELDTQKQSLLEVKVTKPIGVSACNNSVPSDRLRSFHNQYRCRSMALE